MYLYGFRIKLVLISDGQPNDRAGALAVAKKFEDKIHTIYVGPEGGMGFDFLQELANLTGGKSVNQKAEKLNLLEENLTALLTG